MLFQFVFKQAESSVDPEKSIPAKKDSMVNWAQMHNQSLAIIVYRSPMNAAFQWKATDWAAKSPALCSCHLSDSYKRAPKIKIWPISYFPEDKTSLDNQL